MWLELRTRVMVRTHRIRRSQNLGTVFGSFLARGRASDLFRG